MEDTHAPTHTSNLQLTSTDSAGQSLLSELSPYRQSLTKENHRFTDIRYPRKLYTVRIGRPQGKF